LRELHCERFYARTLLSSTHHKYLLQLTNSVLNHTAWLSCAANERRVARYCASELMKRAGGEEDEEEGRRRPRRVRGRRSSEVYLARSEVDSTA